MLPLHGPDATGAGTACTGTAVAGDGRDGTAAPDPVLYTAAKPAAFREPSEVNTTYIEPLAAVTVAGSPLPVAATSTLDDAVVPSYTLTKS